MTNKLDELKRECLVVKAQLCTYRWAKEFHGTCEKAMSMDYEAIADLLLEDGYSFAYSDWTPAIKAHFVLLFR